MRERKMKLCVFAVAISIVPIMASSADICYQHYDKNNQLIAAGWKPPFDISSPPLSPEYQAARDRGEYVIIAPGNNCSSLDKTPVKPIRIQGTFSVLTSIPSYSVPRESSVPSYQSSPSDMKSIPPDTSEIYSRKARSSGGGRGCGSRGGPGYRLPNGKCASWKD